MQVIVMKVQSKVDSETFYSVTESYLKISRNGDSMKFSYPDIPEKSKIFCPEIQNELMEFYKIKHPTVTRDVCGKEFVAQKSNQKRCSKECSAIYDRKRTNERNKKMRKSPNVKDEKKKAASGLNEKIKAAAAMGLTYGQYQALQTIEQIRGGQL